MCPLWRRRTNSRQYTSTRSVKEITSYQTKIKNIEEVGGGVRPTTNKMIINKHFKILARFAKSIKRYLEAALLLNKNPLLIKYYIPNIIC